MLIGVWYLVDGRIAPGVGLVTFGVGGWILEYRKSNTEDQDNAATPTG